MGYRRRRKEKEFQERKEKNKVTKSVQGDFASKQREEVSHIACLPPPNPRPNRPTEVQIHGHS
jgi:hypothetical protein